jgi:hypothetical protein
MTPIFQVDRRELRAVIRVHLLFFNPTWLDYGLLEKLS